MPYTECKENIAPRQFTETRLTAKEFVERACDTGQRAIPHKKMLPDCQNVTKQNCVVTKWDTDQFGNQVWAGTESCEPVSKIMLNQLRFAAVSHTIVF